MDEHRAEFVLCIGTPAPERLQLLLVHFGFRPRTLELGRDDGLLFTQVGGEFDIGFREKGRQVATEDVFCRRERVSIRNTLVIKKSNQS